MKFVDIALTFNEGFLNQASVTILSALRSANDSTLYNFYVVSNNLSFESQQKLLDLVTKEPHFSKIEFIHISKEICDNIPKIGNFGIEVNFRLWFPQLLPHLDRVLYIDCDTMVVGDLSDLFYTNLDGKAYGACNEYKINLYLGNCRSDKDRIEFLNKHGFDFYTDNYINSGVILFNLDYCRTHNYTQRASEFLIENKDDPQFVYPDQDVLNVLAKQDGDDVRVFINWKYNIYHSSVIKKFDKNDYDQMICLKFYDITDFDSFKPAIIHYAGNTKPWVRYTGMMDTQYLGYAKELGWKIAYNKIELFKIKLKKLIKWCLPYGIVKKMKQS